MNLHEINPRPWAIVHPRYADAELAFAETLRYLRQQPIGVGWDMAAGRVDYLYDAVDYTVHTRTREDGLQVGRILAELEQQYFALVRGRIDGRDMKRASFWLTRWEMDLLRQSLTIQELGRHGFNTEEGARAGYRGYPLVVTGW